MATIKQYPEDFIVKELYDDFDVSNKPQEYLYAIMMKKNMTTHEAITKIANLLKIDNKDIGYAGNKDKHAMTFQMISLPSRFVDPEKLENLYIEDLKLKFYGYSKNPIKLGQLKGNQFEIRVREIKKLSDFHKIRLRIKNPWIPNYFDDQRFSKYNVLIGKAIVKNKFDEAVKHILKYSYGDEVEKLFNYWRDFDLSKGDNISKIVLQHLLNQPKDFVGAIRRIPSHIALMYIHAYQSYLFNKSLDTFIDLYFTNKFKIKIMNKLWNASIDYIKFLEKTKIPLIGFATDVSKYAFYDVNSIVMKVIVDEGVSFRDFVIHSYPLLTTIGDERYAFVNPEIEIKGVVNPVLKFKLPSGSYATIVIKTIFGLIGEEVIDANQNKT